MAKSRRLPPVHPGEVLREDLMVPLGLSINRLARDLRVPVTRMSEIVNGRRSITADTQPHTDVCAATAHVAWRGVRRNGGGSSGRAPPFASGAALALAGVLGWA